jgi:hypothetical protein
VNTKKSIGRDVWETQHPVEPRKVGGLWENVVVGYEDPGHQDVLELRHVGLGTEDAQGWRWHQRWFQQLLNLRRGPIGNDV